MAVVLLRLNVHLAIAYMDAAQVGLRNSLYNFTWWLNNINIFSYARIYQFVFLVKGFFLSEAGKECSNGCIAVDEIETCKVASKMFNLNFKTSQQSNNWPIGCYVHGKNVYYNYVSMGRLHDNARLICKSPRKGRIYYLECLY